MALAPILLETRAGVYFDEPQYRKLPQSNLRSGIGGVAGGVVVSQRVSAPPHVFLHPLPYIKINQGYRRGHFANDLDCSKGEAIYAADRGIVTFAGKWGGYGNRLELTHSNGFQTTYSHLATFSVKLGQTVEAGTPVGTCGLTGYTTGYHLHWEVIYHGVKLNPANYL